MVFSGINKRKLELLGCKYKCLVVDDEIVKLVKEKGIICFMVVVEIVVKEEGRKIFVLGNVLIVLYKVMEMKLEGRLDLDVVIGVFVGFVGV